MSTEQQLDLEREDRHHESTQARLSDRLKFACCRRCGSADGMQSVHRDTLASMPIKRIGLLADIYAIYGEPGNDEYLFYPCPHCNRDRVIFDGYESLSLRDVLYWITPAPDTQMAPDYAALAAEEPVLASEDSRASAGI